ncbi:MULTISPECIES: hypothetical protein [Brevibacillus]|uniref:DUF4399 domain-containing protein n=1 Tax=Brevibacillus laterosporus TaxID=1465 RepID=A0AAP3DGU4_BRELA|nr:MULTISPECIES: hypothetical protein [Brevibacillus]ATO50864.1 hypothetical protein BrL25_18275 [Brevibacillus laterosporus DSM 25]AYB38925.1 hypothetical protein D5F52_11950 [Brevibacillus laterosporus]MBG9774381.1 hypothetical protein [Brevibacillus laterosporus]MBG9789927.1 hypothetical protein [Brevibacillus laterosporus]MBG9797885.1 hypothetical protein [Brevibacillus laterosporus]
MIQKLRGRRFYLFILFVAILELSMMGLHSLEGKKATHSNQTHVLAEEVKKPSLIVEHQVKGNDLELKLVVQGFQFSLENMGKENKVGEGHVHLYVDGKKIAKIFGPQFTLADVAPGKHKIEVELAHNNHESYGVKQTFEIVVN